MSTNALLGAVSASPTCAAVASSVSDSVSGPVTSALFLTVGGSADVTVQLTRRGSQVLVRRGAGLVSVSSGSGVAFFVSLTIPA